MTNFEWLLKENIALVKKCLAAEDGFGVEQNGKIDECRVMYCEDCIFSKPGKSCTPVKREWLEAERNPYTIPLDTTVDTKVLVSDDGATWGKRYFAGFSKNKEYPYIVFQNGVTSWTNEGAKTMEWKYCKLAEEGEQK